MKIAVSHHSQFEVNTAPAEVFNLLADIPRSVSHFPDVAQLVGMDDNTWRWEMQAVGALNIRHQVIYACRYVNDLDQRGLAWTPVDGIGNGRIGGCWKLTANDTGTNLDFATEGELEIPVALPLRALARPFVERQFRQQVQQYLDNLRQTLDH